MIDIEKVKLDLKMSDSMKVAGCHVLSRETYNDVYNALTELERLQKKETPIKVIKNGGYDTCPNCKKIVPYEWVNVHKQHCGYCGQKIKYGVKLSKVGEKEWK